MEDYSRKLELADLLRQDVIARAAGDLGISAGDQLLDAGCGTGSHLPLLAGLADSQGQVTGLDNSPEMISRAARRVAGHGLEDRVTLVEGDIEELPFEAGSFDCVLSVDCAGYPCSSNPDALLRELLRVTAPGGTVALLGWTCQQILPGYPLLESKLNTASSLVRAAATDRASRTHFLRALEWFSRAGLGDLRARSYAGSIQAPLTDMKKEAVLSLIDMLWGDSGPPLSADERKFFDEITRPGSGKCILDSEGYYGFFVYTAFSGRAFGAL